MTFSVSITGSRKQAPYVVLTADEEKAMNAFVETMKKATADLREAGFSATGSVFHPTSVEGKSENVVL